MAEVTSDPLQSLSDPDRHLGAFRFVVVVMLVLMLPGIGIFVQQGDMARLLLTLFAVAVTLLALLLFQLGFRYFTRVSWLTCAGAVLLTRVFLIGDEAHSELLFFMLIGLPFLFFAFPDERRTAFVMAGVLLAMAVLAFARDLIPQGAIPVLATVENPEQSGGRTLAMRLLVAAVVIAQVWYFSGLSHRATRAAHMAMWRASSAARVKGQFLANMSHEIRTPMNGIVGMIEILQTMDLSDKQKRAVATIRSSAFALLRIIDDILDASKIEAGKLDIEASNIELKPLIEGSALTVQPMSDDLEVRLHLLLHPNLPDWVMADAGRLRQVLLNLLSNAIKYSSAKLTGVPGQVKFHAKKGVGNTVELTISDNGIGMSEKVQEELFKPFAAGEATSRKQVGGTGLGLAITRELVELMAGEIRVNSAEGRGTTVRVVLPMPPGQGKSTDYRLDGMHIYYVAPQSDYERELCRIRFVEAGAKLEFVDDPKRFFAATVAMEPKPIFVIPPIALTRDPGLCDRIKQHLPEARLLRLSSVRHAEFGYVGPDTYQIQTHPTLASDLYRGLHYLDGRRNLSMSEAQQSSDTDLRKTLQNYGELRVLVVEDNTINQTVLASQLDLLGFDHRVASNGAEGLREWQSGLYDLVLTDCHMPEMDGFEMVRQMRQIETDLGATATPVIAITANAQSGEAKKCIDAGMDDYLAKPVELANLRDKLIAALEPGG